MTSTGHTGYHTAVPTGDTTPYKSNKPNHILQTFGIPALGDLVVVAVFINIGGHGTLEAHWLKFNRRDRRQIHAFFKAWRPQPQRLFSPRSLPPCCCPISLHSSLLALLSISLPALGIPSSWRGCDKSHKANHTVQMFGIAAWHIFILSRLSFAISLLVAALVNASGDQSQNAAYMDCCMVPRVCWGRCMVPCVSCGGGCMVPRVSCGGRCMSCGN